MKTIQHIKNSYLKTVPQRLLLLFLIAFFLRLGYWQLNKDVSFILPDSKEHYDLSVNLNPEDVTNIEWKFSNWYDRTPVYTLYLHITKRSISIQILLSCLTALLLYNINRTAGWIWTLYPYSIIYSALYMKFTLLVFLLVVVYALFYDRKIWLLIIIPVIMLGFGTYGGVMDYNLAKAGGIKINESFWHMWTPFSFGVYSNISEYYKYFMIVPYLGLMILWIKRGFGFNIETILVVCFTVVFTSIFGAPRYREFLMPFILVSTFRGK